jgi:general secretion pathway protein C
MEKIEGISLPSGMDIPRLSGWLNTLLVLLLAYSMATLTWQILSSSVDQDFTNIPVTSSRTKPQSGGPSLDTVAALHLFGEAGSAPVMETAPIDAPETRLKFTLKGVFADSRTDSAMAIISSGSKDEKSYRVGDVVAGAATLHQILGDRVILKRGEQLETLYLPREPDSSAPAFSRTMPINRRASPVARPLSARGLGGVRRRLMENPQEALQMINAQPVMENGRLSGFRVNPGKDRALFARAGLRPGDVVTAVNGMQLTDATQMGQVFQQLKSAQQLEVTINRGGRKQQLQLKLD